MTENKERIKDICNYIEEYQFEYKRTPSMQEIADAVGTVKSNVYKYLDKLQRHGVITRSGRDITINSALKTNTDMNRAPLIGSIACGEPEFTEECFEEYIPLPVALFGKGDFFILRAHGMSMIEAGIEPGDLVVVRKQHTADNGDIVVALVDNDTTLKRYFYDEEIKRVRLHPENKKMKDIFPTNCYIQGIAQNVIKAL